MLWAPSASLDGNLQSKGDACGKLEMINLAHNIFSEEITRNFNLCDKIWYLDLSYNRLNGGLIRELMVPYIVVFDVSGNFLFSSIPNF